MPLTKITGSSIADGTVVAADIADGSITGSVNFSESGGNKIYKFTSSGSISFQNEIY